MRNKGQQEIVGFVLIVVLVVIASMIFLVISIKNHSSDNKDSAKVSNMLDALMSTTTNCAIVYEPNYDNFEELFKSCFKKEGCVNLNESACNYLNKTFFGAVSAMARSDASVKGWEGAFFLQDGKGMEKWGSSVDNCTGSTEGAQRTIMSGSTNLIVRIKICNE